MRTSAWTRQLSASFSINILCLGTSTDSEKNWQSCSQSVETSSLFNGQSVESSGHIQAEWKHHGFVGCVRRVSPSYFKCSREDVVLLSFCFHMTVLCFLLAVSQFACSCVPGKPSDVNRQKCQEGESVNDFDVSEKRSSSSSFSHQHDILYESSPASPEQPLKWLSCQCHPVPFKSRTFCAV